MKFKIDVSTIIHLAEKSLKGLSISDAFGNSFFDKEDVVKNYIYTYIIPSSTRWEFKDDTFKAIAAA